MRITALLFATFAVSIAAAQPAKEPWKWTTEERLRVRFDASARSARLAEYARSETRSAGAASGSDVDVIDGRTHPELFLPSELFEALVFLRVTKPQWLRDDVASRSDDVLRSAAEQSRFAAMTDVYGKTLLQERALLTEKASAGSRRAAAIDAALEELRKTKRTAEAAALREVRKTFGRERFDRFLYTVVAPARRKFVMRGSSDEVTVKALREREAHAGESWCSGGGGWRRSRGRAPESR
jgi:hypothetical protein